MQNLPDNGGERAPSQPKVSRAFNGVWIPASLWTRKDVTWFQKCLLAEIGSFEECFASNAYLAELMGTTESYIAKEISKLRSLGLVLDMGFDGRKRIIVIAREAHSNPCGITQESTQGLPRGKGRLSTEVNIDTRVEQRRDSNQSKEVRRRTFRVSQAEKDRLLEEATIPPNAPSDAELAEILSRFPVLKKWRPDMFYHLKFTKFRLWRKGAWIAIGNLPKCLAKLERKCFIEKGKR